MLTFVNMLLFYDSLEGTKLTVIIPREQNCGIVGRIWAKTDIEQTITNNS